MKGNFFRIRALAEKFLYRGLVRVNAYKCPKFQVFNSISYIFLRILLCCPVVFDLFCNVLFGLFFFVFLLLVHLMANKVVYIMYLLVTSYTVIMFLKVLTHLILKIKNIIKYVKTGVMEYFNIFMKFLNISK